MWSQELEDQTTVFRKQALEIAKWDRIVMENSDKVGLIALIINFCFFDKPCMSRVNSNYFIVTLLHLWFRSFLFILACRG